MRHLILVKFQWTLLDIYVCLFSTFRFRYIRPKIATESTFILTQCIWSGIPNWRNWNKCSDPFRVEYWLDKHKKGCLDINQDSRDFSMYYFERSHKLERRQEGLIIENWFKYKVITLSHSKQRVLESVESVRWSDDNFVRTKDLLPWKHGIDSCNVMNRGEFERIREPIVQTQDQRLYQLENSLKFT